MNNINVSPRSKRFRSDSQTDADRNTQPSSPRSFTNVSDKRSSSCYQKSYREDHYRLKFYSERHHSPEIDKKLTKHDCSIKLARKMRMDMRGSPERRLESTNASTSSRCDILLKNFPPWSTHSGTCISSDSNEELRSTESMHSSPVRGTNSTENESVSPEKTLNDLRMRIKLKRNRARADSQSNDFYQKLTKEVTSIRKSMSKLLMICDILDDPDEFTTVLRKLQRFHRLLKYKVEHTLRIMKEEFDLPSERNNTSNIHSDIMEFYEKQAHTEDEDQVPPKKKDMVTKLW